MFWVIGVMTSNATYVRLWCCELMLVANILEESVLVMVAISSLHRDYHVPAAWLLSVLHNLSSILSKSTGFIFSFEVSSGHR